MFGHFVVILVRLIIQGVGFFKGVRRTIGRGSGKGRVRGTTPLLSSERQSHL